ncbi:MAG TPA: hemerythrin domain-containing protein [Nevskiaceae bacterium]|nr:hemerythrin domain-containing protein [Nevskiaceae bacterium]
MASIAHWFGFGSATKANKGELKQTRAEAAITYSAQLVPSLLSDHKELFKLYDEITAALEAGQFDSLPKLLGTFKTKLDVHLLSENLRFYCYLEQSLAHHPNELEIMKGFRREMNDIARAAVNFVRKWQVAGITPGSVRTFTMEAKQVRTLLEERMQREESGLYPLYTSS